MIIFLLFYGAPLGLLVAWAVVLLRWPRHLWAYFGISALVCFAAIWAGDHLFPRPRDEELFGNDGTLVALNGVFGLTMLALLLVATGAGWGVLVLLRSLRGE